LAARITIIFQMRCATRCHVRGHQHHDNACAYQDLDGEHHLFASTSLAPGLLLYENSLHPFLRLVKPSLMGGGRDGCDQDFVLCETS
jgi:hypothetical protein